MYAFGNLHEKCAWGRNEDMINLVNTVLENHIHTHLSTPHPLLQARACSLEYVCLQNSSCLITPGSNLDEVNAPSAFLKPKTVGNCFR